MNFTVLFRPDRPLERGHQGSSVSPEPLRSGWRGILPLLLLLLAAVPVALATPDQIVRVDEVLLGTSDTGYAVLRTETDNLGSYYSGRVKRYLDEYLKEGEGNFEMAISRRIQSKLILDVSTSVDADHPGLSKKDTVNEKDSTLLLADLLLKYPMTAAPWNEEAFRRLASNQKSGVYLDSKLCLIYGGAITEQFFGNRYPDLEWKLEAVLQDGNALFLKISKRSPDEISEVRLVGIPQRRSRQAMDYLSLRPFYLIAGTCPTLEEARHLAAALIEKSRSTKIVSFTPEIWSLREVDDRTVFVVTDVYSLEHIANEGYKEFEPVLGVKFSFRSSNRFMEKFDTVPLDERPK